jgi:hypothetical protein
VHLPSNGNSANNSNTHVRLSNIEFFPFCWRDAIGQVKCKLTQQPAVCSSACRKLVQLHNDQGRELNSHNRGDDMSAAMPTMDIPLQWVCHYVVEAA